MDWALFHLLNGAMSGRDLAQDPVEAFAAVSVPLFAVATLLLWLGDRPGQPPRWRLACTSAFLAAGLGLLVSQVIGHVWFRERPYAAHPADTVLLTSPSPDPSFPSDHATAAFAIGVAVLLVSRRAGAIFLALAVAIGLSRIFVGVHYPGDVAGGALTGAAAALTVSLLAREPLRRLTLLLGRYTDPAVRPVWAALAGLITQARGLARR